jgi:DNA-binding HxlR family transcriptional regulator
MKAMVEEFKKKGLDIAEKVKTEAEAQAKGSRDVLNEAAEKSVAKKMSRISEKYKIKIVESLEEGSNKSPQKKAEELKRAVKV